jgi:hypothetical protein
MTRLCLNCRREREDPMRRVSFVVAALAVMAFAAASLTPATAQQCPKGKSWDYGSQSCK